MTKDEALKLALGALEKLVDSFADVSAYEDEEHAFTNELIFIPDIKKAIKAIAAAKQALAQPEQRQPLTDDEMSALEEKVYMQTKHKGATSFEYAQALIRAVEGAHNIGAKP